MAGTARGTGTGTGSAASVAALGEIVVRISVGRRQLEGRLEIPPQCRAVVLFTEGGPRGRTGRSDRGPAAALHRQRIGTLMLDLLTDEEQRSDPGSVLAFDIDRLVGGLVAAMDWLRAEGRFPKLPQGIFAAGTGAAAALLAAAQRPGHIDAIVCCGGRPDLAATSVTSIEVPALFLVGAKDQICQGLNRMVVARLASKHKELVVIPGAGRLFDEPGALEQVAERSVQWFMQHLSPWPAATDEVADDAPAPPPPG
jgi:putative phosphoribosyl transferase